MMGITRLIGGIILFLHLASLVSGVPARTATTCSFPPGWLDIWLEPAGNTTVSILERSFAEAGQCVLQLESNKQLQSFILRSSRTTCFHCVHIQELHSNVLRYQISECQVQRQVS